MNKKILLSLSTIAAVAAIAIGGTVAYFSDTETSTGNTFSAGTIDIAVNDQNPWSHDAKYDIKDLKPGESGNINLKVSNVGTNPVDITKNLTSLVGNSGASTYNCNQIVSGAANTSSEPECVEENGTVVNDIQSQVSYTLAVEVYNQANTKIWWQQIYDGAKLTDVYTGSNSPVELGMIPVGGYMMVNQNYKLAEATGNKYQGDGFTFNMELKGNQLAQLNGYNAVTLENKDGAPDWQIISDEVKGTLNYKTTGSMFSYTFTGKVNTASVGYNLVYVGPSGNFPFSGNVLLGTATADTSKNITIINGNVDTGSIANGKVWLVPATSYPSGWDQANTLFETALVDYTKN